MSASLKAIRTSRGALFDSIALVWKFFRFDSADLGILIPVSVSYGLLSLAVPLGVQVLINRILSTALISQALWIVGLVAIGLAAAGFLRIKQRILVERLQRRLHSRVVLAAATSLNDGNTDVSADRASRCYYDTFIVQKTVSSLLMEGLAALMQLSFALILLAFYHPFFLAFDLVIVLLLLAVVGLPFPHLLDTAVAESQAKHSTSAFLSKLRGFDPVEVDRVAVGYLTARGNHFRLILTQMVGLSGLHVLGSVLLLGIGTILVMKEQMSLGQLVAAELVFSLAFLSLEKLNKHLENFYDLFAALTKLEHVVSQEDPS